VDESLFVRNIKNPLQLKEELYSLSPEKECRRKMMVATLISEAMVELQKEKKEEKIFLKHNEVESYFGLEV
jgi:hypothetical protein